MIEINDNKRLLTTKTSSSIATKLTFYITMLVFGIMLFTSFYMARQQENLLTDKMTRGAENLSRALVASFSEAIISNQLESLQGSVEEVKNTDPDIASCEVYDRDGKCIASAAGKNRGRTPDENGVFSGLVRSAMESAQTARTHSANRQFLELAIPLVIGKSVKGSLFVKYSLANMNSEIASSYLHSIMICIAAIVLGWLISAFLSQRITTPIFDLVNGANEVLKGNFDYKVTKISDDETGIISTAFNSVTENLTNKIRELHEYSENLARINAELDKKINEMRSLQELGKVISSIFNLEELLRAIIQNSTIVMKSKRCSIVLVNEKTGDYYIKVAKGMEEGESFIENIKLKTGGLVTDYCTKQKLPLLVTDMESDDRFPKLGDGKYRTRSFIAVPLIVNDRVIGVISVTEKFNNEIYNQSDIQLLQIFANQVVIAIENAKLYEKLVVREKLERELEIAHNIQMSMLPQKYPEIKGFTIAGVSIPAKEVGGDYYDFLPITDTKVAITIGDVSGKGVPAALMMVMIHSVLRAKVMSEHAPKDLVFELNKSLMNELEPRMFITFFYMLLDTETKVIRYTNAGHNYPMVFHAGNTEVESLKDGGLLLGVFEEPVYEEGSYQLSDGDVVVMYTDGIVEAMNEKDEMYGYEVFSDLVHSIKHKRAEEIKQDILDDVKKFMGEAAQYDDLTLIVIKIDRNEVHSSGA